MKYASLFSREIALLKSGAVYITAGKEIYNSQFRYSVVRTGIQYGAGGHKYQSL